MVHTLYFALLKIFQETENMLSRVLNMSGRFASAIRALGNFKKKIFQLQNMFLLQTLEKSSILVHKCVREK